MEPWSWRHGPGDPPGPLTDWLRRRPHGDVLAPLLWRRGVDTPEAAVAFLQPTLARGLRPPAALAGVERAGARLAAWVADRHIVRVAAAEDAASVVAAVAVARWLEAAGHAVVLVRPPGGDVQLDPGGIRVGEVSAPVPAADPALSLAGLAFYVCAAARAAGRGAGVIAAADPREVLDLVALGTVLAAAVLREESRVLVSAGLRSWCDRPRPGLQALAETAAIERPTARLLAERVAPRLAAAVGAGLRDDVVALLRAGTPGEARALATSLEVGVAVRGARPVVAPSGDPGPTLVDAELSLARLTPGLVLALAQLEPHGPGNPEPVLLARGVRLEGARLVGDPGRSRWRLRVRQEGRTRRAAAAGIAVPVPDAAARYDVAYVPRLASAAGSHGVEIAVHRLWLRAAENS